MDALYLITSAEFSRLKKPLVGDGKKKNGIHKSIGETFKNGHLLRIT